MASRTIDRPRPCCRWHATGGARAGDCSPFWSWLPGHEAEPPSRPIPRALDVLCVGIWIYLVGTGAYEIARDVWAIVRAAVGGGS